MCACVLRVRRVCWAPVLSRVHSAPLAHASCAYCMAGVHASPRVSRAHRAPPRPVQILGLVVEEVELLDMTVRDELFVARCDPRMTALRPPRAMEMRHFNIQGSLPVYFDDAGARDGEEVRLELSEARYIIMSDRISHKLPMRLLYTKGTPAAGCTASVIELSAVKRLNGTVIVKGQVFDATRLREVWVEQDTGCLHYALCSPITKTPPLPAHMNNASSSQCCVVS